MKRKLIALAICLSLSVSACSTSASDEGSPARPTGFAIDESIQVAADYNQDWESEVLGDGVITAQEYEEAHDRFIQCQLDLGFTMKKEKSLDPINSVQWHSVVLYQGSDATDDLAEKMDATCGHRYFNIETPYLALQTGYISDEILPDFQACLSTIPVAPTGSEKSIEEFSELAAGDSTIRNSIFDCVEGTVKLKLPGVLYSMAYRS